MIEDPSLDNCRSCNMPVIWVLSPAGKRMPLDARPWDEIPEPKAKRPTLYWIEDGDPPQAVKVYATGGVMEPDIRYISHFVTCAQAGQWSGRGRGQ